jgi:hypothetical protein
MNRALRQLICLGKVTVSILRPVQVSGVADSDRQRRQCLRILRIGCQSLPEIGLRLQVVVFGSRLGSSAIFSNSSDHAFDLLASRPCVCAREPAVPIIDIPLPDGPGVVAYERTAYTVTKGEITKFESTPGKTERGFCARCGSTLTCETVGLPTLTDFHVGAFDHAELFRPTRHIFPEERLPWLRLADT